MRILTALLFVAVMHGASLPPARATNGMVSSASAPATDVGVEILRKGGNAVDAAVATAFALAVTYPAAGNIGGGGFMIVRMADGRAAAIDYRETAPAQASKIMFLDASGQVIPNASKTGHPAVGVPGTVAGMVLAHQKFGKLPWKDIVAPAIRLAKDGFPVSYSLAHSLRAQEKKFSPYAASRRIFHDVSEGALFRQPELAATLQRIATRGRSGFYEGETAALLAKEMSAHGGLVGLDDLKNYQAVMREPVRVSYRGYELLSMPPASSGGFLLAHMLGILSGYDLARLGHNSSATYHLLIEAMKRAYADRAAYFGDPAFVKVPLAGLLSPSYIERRRGEIDENRATPSQQVREGQPPSKESSETTHFSVVDAAGNAVSNTYTLRDGYGSGITVEGAGFLLNNVMDEFAAKAGAPNAFGFPAGEANTIAPGKRPISSQTPAIGVKQGKLAFVVGTPGGTTIPNTVLQVVLNLIDHGMNVQEAVDAPRIHHQWLPDEVQVEKYALSEDVIRALKAKGHHLVSPARSRIIGMVHAIAIDPDTGVRLGASDARGADGKAAGH